MDDKDRGPNKAGLKKLCTMAKAILPPTSHSTPDNDVEMHNLQTDTSPQASTETASASDINYYVEREKTSAPTTGKHSVLSKRRTRQISPPVGTTVESKQSPENVAAASACPVDQRDNEENSSTKIQGDKQQPGKSINPIKTEIPNPVIESTEEGNVGITAAGATAKFDVAVKSKKQITKKSVQKIQAMKSSSRSTGEKQQTVNQNTTNTKPSMKSKLVSTTQSTKLTPTAPLKKKVGECNSRTGESIPQVTSIRRIEKSTVVYKSKPVATPSKHENSPEAKKKNKNSEIALISASVFSGENSITSSSKELLTEDDSGDSMEVQFSTVHFVEKSLEDVKDFRLSSKTKTLAVPVEGDESINASLAPNYEVIKTPIEPFLTEEVVSDIVSMNKKIPKARAKYISSRDSVFTIDTNWATAPNVVLDIEYQPIRPETSPGRIIFGMDFDEENCQDLPSKLLPSEPRPDDNQTQERKRSSRSADWRSHDSAYAEAPELYSVVVLEPVTPPNEIQTDFEINPEDASPQSVHDTTHDLEKPENPENLPSTQVQNGDFVCHPEPHSPNEGDPTMGNFPSPSGASTDSSPEHRPQPSNDSTETSKNNSSQDSKTTLSRRGSAKQEELNQYLNYLEDETASPTHTASPGIFWNFFQLFGAVLNIFRPATPQQNGNSSGENGREEQTANVIIEDDGSGRASASGSLKSGNSSDEEEDNGNSKQKKDKKDHVMAGDNRNENGDNKALKQDANTYNGPYDDECPKYPYKDLFTCFTNKMYWFGISPNIIDAQRIKKWLSKILQILAIIIILLSFADSLMMVKFYGVVFLHAGWELHEFINLSFNVMHALTKGYFLFLVTLQWDTVIAFVPLHHDLMRKCCSNRLLEEWTKWNEFLGNCMRAVTILMATLYAIFSKIDLTTTVVTLANNFRINAAATDFLVYLWGADEDKNATRTIINTHLNADPMSYETFIKGMLGAGMEFSGQAHDEIMLDTIITVVACLRLSTLVVVEILKRAAPDGVDRQAYNDWQWMVYQLLRLLAETINATFGMLWTFMHYHNLLMIANFGFQMLWEPSKVMWWFQGSSIVKLSSIYYLGQDTHSQNTFIEEWIRDMCADKTEIKLGGKVYNVILLIDDVTKNPIGFGQGKCFITGDFIYHVIEKVASYFIMLASFRQKPCDCEELCKKLLAAFAATFHHKE